MARRRRKEPWAPPFDLGLRSYRVHDALLELRVARRIGRRLDEDEAERLVAQTFDRLQLRVYLRRNGWRLARDGGRLVHVRGADDVVVPP